MNDGGPAFPIPASFLGSEEQQGMTLRDWFGGMACQAFIAAHSGKVHLPTATDAAHWAYAYADAMLEERLKEK